MTAADRAFVHTTPNILRQIYFQNSCKQTMKSYISDTLLHSVLFCFFHHIAQAQLSAVCVPCARAAGCSTVITHWMGIAISGSGPRVTVMGSKCVAAAGGNGASMSEETDFTSEMKSSEKTVSVLQHISGMLFYLSCLQQILYHTITFWKRRGKKRLQIVWLRIRVQKTITKPKDLRFSYKMTEFWEPKSGDPLLCDGSRFSLNQGWWNSLSILREETEWNVQYWVILFIYLNVMFKNLYSRSPF